MNEYPWNALALFNVMESNAVPYIRGSDDRRGRGTLSKGAGSEQYERECQKQMFSAQTEYLRFRN